MAAVGPAISRLIESVLESDMGDPEQAIAHCAVFIALSAKYEPSLQELIVDRARIYADMILSELKAEADVAPPVQADEEEEVPDDEAPEEEFLKDYTKDPQSQKDDPYEDEELDVLDQVETKVKDRG